MLDTIVAQTKQQVQARKEVIPLNVLQQEILPGSFSLLRSLQEQQWALIAECKLASPVKGQLCSSHTVPELARVFSENGATALSVHTNQYFQGQLADIGRVRAVSDLPILRKEFIVDEYQIYEARAAGADAILLIAAVLTSNELVGFQACARNLGMDCLVEVHTLEELQRVQQTPAELIGINNRNLQTFATDINTTFNLLSHCDKHRIIISESGIRSSKEARLLKQAGVRGALIGEGLVKASDIALLVQELVNP